MRRVQAWKRWGGGLLSVIFLLSGSHLPTAGAVSSPGETPVVDRLLAESSRDKGYRAYLAARSGAVSPLQDIRLSAEQAQLTGNGRLIAGLGPQGEAQVALFDGDGKITWTVEVPESGFYHLAFGYYTQGEGTKDIPAALLIDGEAPFSEMEVFAFSRLWKDIGMGERDLRGNDIRPKQEQVVEWRERTLYNEEGIEEDYRFYLEKGSRSITLSVGKEIAVESLRVYNRELPTYKTYIQAHAGAGAIADFSYPVQGEAMTSKSESSILPGIDRSGPATQPSDPLRLRLNILDGGGFSKPGQQVTWTVEVEEAGLYHIGMRVRQNELQGLFVSRRVYIDGEIPFQELEAARFIYRDSWQYAELGDGENAYDIYLTPGKHTIILEAVSGELAPVISELEDDVFVLNTLLRKIVMITGTTPDTYRDYSLETEIPELVSVMREMASRLTSLSAAITDMTGSSGGIATVIRQTTAQLERFCRDPAEIPSQLEYFKSNISALSSLMISMQSQPLDIDYLLVTGAADPQPKTEAGFFSSIGYQLQAFFGSFVMDYSAVSAGGDTSEAIKVWYSGSREQAEIVRQMVDDDFTIGSGIGVTLELAQVPIHQAILAGTAPDVMMNVSRTQPVNLAARDALCELSALPGFAALQEQFIDSAFVPYTYENGVYGLPVTMDYHVMFVRDDILAELGLSPPETWEEFYALLPVIQRNNMEIGIPYTTMSSQATIEGGIGARDIFPALVLQREGRFYQEDLTATALDTTPVLDAFQEWTELYTKFGLSLTYDFYNRFRTGEMPIGIQSYGMFNMLEAAAPEIRGMWSMRLIPGTLDANGNINRAESASGSGTVLINRSGHQEAGWEFMKWWVSADVQARYGREVEMQMGTAQRYNTANLQAVEQLPWKEEQLETLRAQREFVEELPEVVGGYYMSRNLDAAFRGVLFNDKNVRDALREQAEGIDSEIARKREEFHLNG